MYMLMTMRKEITRYESRYVIPIVAEPQLPGDPRSLSGKSHSSSFIIPSNTPSQPADVDIYTIFQVLLLIIQHALKLQIQDGISEKSVPEIAESYSARMF